jgi:hypothetical protein
VTTAVLDPADQLRSLPCQLLDRVWLDAELRHDVDQGRLVVLDLRLQPRKELPDRAVSRLSLQPLHEIEGRGRPGEVVLRSTSIRSLMSHSFSTVV